MTTSDSAFDAELDRRLREIEAPDYDDPARADLPTRELVVVLLAVLVVVVLVHLWGY